MTQQRQVGWFADDFGMHDHWWLREPESSNVPIAGLIRTHAACRPIYVEESHA